MASSYSTDLKLELMVTGENSGTWGDKTNTNLNLIQQAVAGYQSIALTSTNTTLSMTNATISNARNAVIEFTGTLSANSTVYVESGIEKTYTIKNSTTGAFTLALNQVGGSSVIWGTTEKNIKGVYLNGTNANTIDLSTLGGAINSSASLADFVVGSNELDTASVTSVKIASFAVTSGALDTASVTSVKIAAAAVGPTQLANTNVTAGSYTAASITVDAQGRITAASSGSGGAGGFVPTQILIGPGSGTYTSSPTANRILAFGYGGAGGRGGHITGYENHGTGGAGGLGGLGYYNVPIVQPYSQPYVVGATGNNGANSPNSYGGTGNAGGTTTLGPSGSVFSITGGNGGNGGQFPDGNPGNTGTATPSGSLSIPSNNRNFYVGGTFGDSGAGKLIIFENTGT